MRLSRARRRGRTTLLGVGPCLAWALSRARGAGQAGALWGWASLSRVCAAHAREHSPYLIDPGKTVARSPRQCLECFEGPVVEPRAEWVVGAHFDHMPLGQEFLLLGCFLTMARSPRPFKLMVHVMSPI